MQAIIQRNINLKIFVVSLKSSFSTPYIKAHEYSTYWKVVPVDEAKRFMKECFLAVGAPEHHAELVAHTLVLSDYAGHYGHGMLNLYRFINNVKEKICDPNAVPQTIIDTPAIALVDGNHGFGSIVGNYCVDIAIRKAREHGVSLVLSRNSHYNRILALYNLKAVQEGIISFCASNTPACMSPEHAKRAILGCNPLSAGAPAEKDDYFLLDMATTEASLGKIEIHRQKHLPLPLGWAKDKLGRITTNTEVAAEANLLLPLGGSKGFYTAMMIEIFSAILTGGKSMLYITHDSPKDISIGHIFFAVNCDFFAPNFRSRMSNLMNYIREVEPVDPKKPVMVPSDPERIHMRKVDAVGGLQYGRDQLEICQTLSANLNVKPLQTKSVSNLNNKTVKYY